MALGKAAKGGLATRKAIRPKAGPKKRRATEEERLRAAVEANTRKPKSVKTGRVREYKYKEVTPTAKVEGEDIEQVLLYGLRDPKGPSEFEQFVATLEDDQKPHAKKLYQMGCPHPNTEVVMEGVSWMAVDDRVKHVRCNRCHLIAKFNGSKTEAKRQEWIGYCPDGFDMFEWDELFVADKTLWPFIHDEAEYAMLADSMTEED